jgi:hypothetical protein
VKEVNKRKNSLFNFGLALGGIVIFIATPGFSQSIKMQAFTELKSSGAKPQVIGGEPADAKKWPATFIFRNSNGGGCTATAVGRQAVITAAHCIDDGAKGSISVGTLTADVVCNHHPTYPDDISADFALCVLNKALPKLGDGFERLNTADNNAPAKGKDVTLLGYGCRVKGGSDQSFGNLYEGTAKVVVRPSKDLYVRTQGGAALCFGDSGGGAYHATNPAGTTRRLFGINSRGDISTNSWISTTANKSFIDWSRGWADKNKIKICGLDSNAEDCRQ